MKEEQEVLGGARLLIVDDDVSNLKSLTRIFEREGVEVISAADGQEALEVLRRHRIGVCLTDLMMPRMSGQDLMRAAHTVSPETVFILMTAFGTVEKAVEAMKEGAWDFVTKPFKRIQIVRAVRRALDRQELVRENQMLRARLEESSRGRTIIGNSLAIRSTLDMVEQVAPSSATVLLLGESGTGKELVARAVANASARAKGPLVAVNCAALPDNLLEAELFGHEKGAFTGATALRRGRFEMADGGTLFLDEIGETSAQVQVKLLRVLQEGEIERLGSSQPRSVDVRIVAATNRSLTEEVAAGRFRSDLYYRLAVVEIELPPLRARLEDLPRLCEGMAVVLSHRLERPPRIPTDGALEVLESHAWPGNVRELANLLERVAVCWPDRVFDRGVALAALRPAGASFSPLLPAKPRETDRLARVLAGCRGNVSRAARELGIPRSTLRYRLSRQGGRGKGAAGHAIGSGGRRVHQLPLPF